MFVGFMPTPRWNRGYYSEQTMIAFKGELLSEGPSNITVLPCARLSDSKDRRCKNKVWLYTPISIKVASEKNDA